MRLHVDTIIRATGGTMLSGSRQAEFASFQNDSRRIQSGSLFFAMRGTAMDGHDFVEDAIRRGATGAIVERPVSLNQPAVLIQVSDSFEALQSLARFVRKGSSTKFIGITGSSGKTSTKEFTAALLAKKYSVFKSEGNLNSITGLPLSLLSLEESEVAVFEVAMSQPGEIAALSRLLRPDVGVILNVNAVHLGQFPSVDAICDEKCSLRAGMKEDASVVYNRDDVRLAANLAGRNGVSFGRAKDADLRIDEVELLGVKGSRAMFYWKGKPIPIRTQLAGIGSLYNLAAAATTALLMDLSAEAIESAISSLEAYKQRGILLQARSGAAVYDDSYNSNPAALSLALQILWESKGYARRVAVLGDMLELGPDEQDFHRAAGEQVAQSEVDVLITAGSLARYAAESAKASGVKQVFAETDSVNAAARACELVQAGDVVLVKGSRGMKMEVVVKAICDL